MSVARNPGYIILLPSPETTFTCLFCHHDKSVTVRLDRKEGIAQLVCRVCDQRYQSKVNRVCPFANLDIVLIPAIDLTEPVDIYSEWIDAADAAQETQPVRKPIASSSRTRPPAPDSDDD